MRGLRVRAVGLALVAAVILTGCTSSTLEPAARGIGVPGDGRVVDAYGSTLARAWPAPPRVAFHLVYDHAADTDVRALAAGTRESLVQSGWTVTRDVAGDSVAFIGAERDGLVVDVAVGRLEGTRTRDVSESPDEPVSVLLTVSRK